MKYISLFTFLITIFSSCKKIDLYEKRITIPNYKWDKKFTPTFQFENANDASRKILFVIVRHTNNYAYSNVWVNVKLTSKDTSITYPVNVLLTDDNQNTKWKNSGMDDIYEVKQSVAALTKKTGEYTFTVENIMRDNPLQEILHIGLRIESVK